MNIATHNGIITIRNPATGSHRTFRVRTNPENSKWLPGKRVLSLLIGSDNESDYKGFAFVGDDGRVHVWRRFTEGPWSTYADMVRRPEAWTEKAGVIEMLNPP